MSKTLYNADFKCSHWLQFSDLQDSITFVLLLLNAPPCKSVSGCFSARWHCAVFMWVPFTFKVLFPVTASNYWKKGIHAQIWKYRQKFAATYGHSNDGCFPFHLNTGLNWIVLDWTGLHWILLAPHWNVITVSVNDKTTIVKFLSTKKEITVPLMISRGGGRRKKWKASQQERGGWRQFTWVAVMVGQEPPTRHLPKTSSKDITIVSTTGPAAVPLLLPLTPPSMTSSSVSRRPQLIIGITTLLTRIAGKSGSIPLFPFQ